MRHSRRPSVLAFLNSTANGAALVASGAVVLDPLAGGIKATRIHALANPYGAAEMLALRASIDAVGGDGFSSSGADIFLEQDAIIVGYALASAGWIFAAVLVTVLVLSLDVRLVLVMGAAALSCAVHMVGWMYLSGLALSSISLIPLLLSAGLCIDYCTHVAASDFRGRRRRPSTAARARVALCSLVAPRSATRPSPLASPCRLLAFGRSGITTCLLHHVHRRGNCRPTPCDGRAAGSSEPCR